MFHYYVNKLENLNIKKIILSNFTKSMKRRFWQIIVQSDCMVNTEKDQFLDRKGHIQIFKEAVNNIGQKEFSVLVYHGIAGIGKTSLRKEFSNYLKEYNDEDNNQKVIWASIDLQLPNYREENTFLITLKNELQEPLKKHFGESKLHFPAFEIAHAIYWKKAHPEIPLRKENYLLFEGDDAFDGFFGVIDQIPHFNLSAYCCKIT